MFGKLIIVALIALFASCVSGRIAQARYTPVYAAPRHFEVSHGGGRAGVFEERGGRGERLEFRGGGRAGEAYVKVGGPGRCDCYGWSVEKCGPHSVTAQACRDRVVTECSIGCPAQDFSDCTAWSVARCTSVATFIGTWCRQIVSAQCVARAQGLKPNYVPERCDCYGQSLYVCGPHSVTNLDCRQREGERCANECKPDHRDCANCAAFGNARCSDVGTYVGTTCRNYVVPACQKECANRVTRVLGGEGGRGDQPASCDCYGWSVYKCGPHSVTAQACRDQVVTECSIRCPAEDFSDCNAWSVARCTNVATFIGTWCRQIVSAQCTARAQGLQPNYVPERCDCYGQSLRVCGPHSVTNLDCRQAEGQKCANECKPSPADCANCAAFGNARCSDVGTYVGTTCRNYVVPACQNFCAGPAPQPAPVDVTQPVALPPAPVVAEPAPVVVTVDQQAAPAPAGTPVETPVDVTVVEQQAPGAPEQVDVTVVEEETVGGHGHHHRRHHHGRHHHGRHHHRHHGRHHHRHHHRRHHHERRHHRHHHRRHHHERRHHYEERHHYEQGAPVYVAAPAPVDNTAPVVVAPAPVVEVVDVPVAAPTDTYN